MADPLPSFLASPSRPKLKLPPGACDAHVHVFGPHKVFPFAENRPFTPADAPKEKLFALHAMLGIRHCVIVQSTCHGFDNRVVADAIAAKKGDYCGVALLPATVEAAERGVDVLLLVPEERAAEAVQVIEAANARLEDKIPYESVTFP